MYRALAFIKLYSSGKDLHDIWLRTEDRVGHRCSITLYCIKNTDTIVFKYGLASYNVKCWSRVNAGLPPIPGNCSMDCHLQHQVSYEVLSCTSTIPRAIIRKILRKINKCLKQMQWQYMFDIAPKKSEGGLVNLIETKCANHLNIISCCCAQRIANLRESQLFWWQERDTLFT